MYCLANTLMAVTLLQHMSRGREGAMKLHTVVLNPDNSVQGTKSGGFRRTIEVWMLDDLFEEDIDDISFQSSELVGLCLQSVVEMTRIHAERGPTEQDRHVDVLDAEIWALTPTAAISA